MQWWKMTDPCFLDVPVPTKAAHIDGNKAFNKVLIAMWEKSL